MKVQQKTLLLECYKNSQGVTVDWCNSKTNYINYTNYSNLTNISIAVINIGIKRY